MLREYCDISNNCTLFHPMCDLSGYTCSEDKMLHLPSNQCFQKEEYECMGTVTESKFIPLKYHKYEVAFVKEVGRYVQFFHHSNLVNIRSSI